MLEKLARYWMLPPLFAFAGALLAALSLVKQLTPLSFSALVGTIVAAFGTALGAWQQNRDRIKSLTNQVHFEQELRGKTEEIANLNRELKDTVTGGDSYAWLRVSGPNGPSNRADLILTREGNYPLYDVQVILEDVDKKLDILRKDQIEGKLQVDTLHAHLDRKKPAVEVRDIGNMAPNVFLSFGMLDLSGRESASFKVRIMALNGSIQQNIRFRRVGYDWKLAYKVNRREEVLQQYIDDGYPTETDRMGPL